MKLTIIRIENHIVTCEVEGGGLIDISKKWFTEDIKNNDVIEFDITKEKYFLQ